MDQIQLQASKLWDLLFSEDTSETYQNALNLTGSILKESAQLIWLVICSVFVFGAWFGDASMKTGNSLRGWIEAQQNPSLAPAEEKPDLAETGRNLLATGRSSFDNFLNTAREQLGLEPVEPAPVKTPAVKKVAAAPATTAPEKAASAAESPKASAPSSAPAQSSSPSQNAPSAGMSPASEITKDVEEISREPDSGDWPPQDID
ncbi:MAG: hypothetical protein AAF810_25155 [Cyanobacteria bacterium P01_D01_bin.36]